MKGIAMNLSAGRSIVVLALLPAHLFSAAEVRAQSTKVFFSRPVNVSHNPRTTLPYSDRVAVDTKGNINVLWADYKCLPVWPFTCTWHLFYARSVDGGTTFSTPKDISNHYSDEALYGPQIAVDGSGNINVVWEGTASGGWEIFFSRSVDGGATFSIPKVISNHAGSAGAPQLAVDSLGNLNVVWQAQQVFDLYSWSIWFSRSGNGGASFSDPKALCDNAEICAWPQIAIESSGAIEVVWAKALCVNCDYDVFFSRSSDRGATFSASQNLSNSSESLITAPEVVVDKGGNINVVWSKGHYWSTGNADVFLSRSTDQGTTFSSRNLSDNRGLSYLPEVGVDALGNINVLWLDDVPGGMLFSRSVNGGADFSTPKNVSTPPSGIAGDLPYLAVASDGDINLAWWEVGRGILFSRSTDGGATFSTPETISGNASIPFFPQIMVDKSGNICVLWFDEMSGTPDVFFTRGITVNALQSDISGLPTSAFKNKSHRRAMLNALADAEQAIANGNSALAVSTLDDLLWHLSGCGATADRNDWIVDCTGQLKIRSSIQIIVASLGGQ
jgi:hypothetical protein